MAISCSFIEHLFMCKGPSVCLYLMDNGIHFLLINDLTTLKKANFRPRCYFLFASMFKQNFYYIEGVKGNRTDKFPTYIADMHFI